MATHSSILAWRIPWTEEPGGLQPMGFHRVRHDWSGLACLNEVKHSFLNTPRQMYLHFSLGSTLCHPHCSHTTFQADSNSPVCIYVFSTRTKADSFKFTFFFFSLGHLLETEMAIHSSILAKRILWTEEPGLLQSMGSKRGEHDWATNTLSEVENILELSQALFLKISLWWYNWHTENI